MRLSRVIVVLFALTLLGLNAFFAHHHAKRFVAYHPIDSYDIQWGPVIDLPYHLLHLILIGGLLLGIIGVTDKGLVMLFKNLLQ